MAKSYPTRPTQHQLEEASVRFLRGHLPKNWTCDKPAADYGVDLRIELFEDTQATGLEFLVQLKSSEQPTEGHYESIRLAVSTYNYLWDKLQVVMLVKYVAADNEAYWIMLRNVPQPNQAARTFTVSIPKTNRLSTITWADVLADVRRVTDTKLAAMRAHQAGLKGAEGTKGQD